jgi:hypothetical protein
MKVQRLSGANRDASWLLKTALERSALGVMHASANHITHDAEVWDVTNLIRVTPETADEVAAEVAQRMRGAPARRTRRTKMEPGSYREYRADGAAFEVYERAGRVAAA